MANQFSDHAIMPLYLWQDILGPLSGAYTLDSTFSSCSFIIDYQYLPQISLTLFIDHFSCTEYSVLICYKLVIASIQLRIQFIMSDYSTCYFVYSVMFYFSFTLSCMLSSFQILTHTCSTSSLDVDSGSQHLDHAQINFPISSSVDSVVSPHFPRTTVMNVISVFSHLVSVFARFRWGLSQYFQSSFEAIFIHSQFYLSSELIFLYIKLIGFSYISSLAYGYAPSFHYNL